MAKTVIEVKNLSKRYRIGIKEKKADTFAGQLVSVIKSPLENFRRLRSMSKFGVEDESVFWALKDINFEVKEGEVLGIIGHNGAGKSTLLKILSRITEPTTGEIHLKGRVSALLEVGTGFHPDLTGRENIYMNGTILGMTKREIDRKLDEIVDFSGVEQYIDTPVKFYSSGMKVRLGFAVAAHLEPEILIIDEVLAVGDAEFQRKCLGKMKEVSSEGRTVLFVSHDMGAIVNLCPNSILMEKGRLIERSESKKIIQRYLSNIEKEKGVIGSDKKIVNKYFEFIELRADQIDNEIRIYIKYQLNESIKDIFVGFSLVNKNGLTLFRTYDLEAKINTKKEKGIIVSEFIIQKDILQPGTYFIKIFIMRKGVEWITKGYPELAIEIFSKTNLHKIHNNGIIQNVGRWNIKHIQ